MTLYLVVHYNAQLRMFVVCRRRRLRFHPPILCARCNRKVLSSSALCAFHCVIFEMNKAEKREAREIVKARGVRV